MRLLNIIRSLNPVNGGPAEGLRQIAIASRELGQDQEVLTLDAPGEPWLLDFPTVTHAVGPGRGTYGYTPELTPWLRKHGHEYDAVVVHGLWQWHGLATRNALQGTGIPYFVFPHGMLDPWFRREYPLKHLKKLLYWPWAEYRVLRDAAALLFTAEEEARLARQTFSPMYRVREAVVGYGTEISDTAALADPETFWAAWPATRGRRNILFLGRIHPKKGCDLLIQAFAMLAKSEPNLHLVMAGPDDAAQTRAGLERMAAELGVADRITWTGMLQGKAKWSALQAAEVFALPSHQENFGIAVAEALASGLPVLISDKINIWREIAADGAGLVGSDTLAGTLETLTGWLNMDPASRAAMRQHAAECYERHFHMKAATKRLYDTISSYRLHAADIRAVT